jgi:hypothetical protein
MPFPADLIPLTALPVSAREWARIISFNVDNIEVAQFTYLLLCNRAICNVIDAIPPIEL